MNTEWRIQNVEERKQRISEPSSMKEEEIVCVYVYG